MDPQLKGTVAGITVASWGTSGAGDSDLGIVQSASKKRDSDKDQLEDEDGFVIGRLFFNHQDILTLEVIALDAAVLPEQGDNLTIGSITGLVESSELKWEKRGWKKISVNATKWANLA